MKEVVFFHKNTLLTHLGLSSPQCSRGSIRVFVITNSLCCVVRVILATGDSVSKFRLVLTSMLLLARTWRDTLVTYCSCSSRSSSSSNSPNSWYTAPTTEWHYIYWSALLCHFHRGAFAWPKSWRVEYHTQRVVNVMLGMIHKGNQGQLKDEWREDK